MADIDELAVSLFEEAKHFYGLAKASPTDVGRIAYNHAALSIAFCALESHLNAISQELLLRSGLGILDKSLLQEADYSLEKGEFVLHEKKLKMYRVEDRVQFLFVRFTKIASPKAEVWWPDLKAGLDLRNRLIHPKAGLTLSQLQIEKTLRSVLGCLNALYLGIFKKKYPALGRDLESSLVF